MPGMTADVDLRQMTMPTIARPRGANCRRRAMAGSSARLAADVPGHVLQIDGVAEVFTDHRHDVLFAAIGSSEAFEAHSRRALTCSHPRS